MHYRKSVSTFGILLPLLFLSLLAASCSEDISGVEGAVVDNANNANKLQQLVAVLNLTDADNRRVVVGGIDSVKVKVNGKPWGAFSSEPLDTAGIVTIRSGNLNVTDRDIGYLVIAAYTIAADSLATAGDFATYLNNRLRLAPGDYICEIAEVHFRNADGEAVVVKPRVYRSFTVTPNVASLYLGEIDITVQ